MFFPWCPAVVVLGSDTTSWESGQVCASRPFFDEEWKSAWHLLQPKLHSYLRPPVCSRHRSWIIETKGTVYQSLYHRMGKQLFFLDLRALVPLSSKV